MNELILAGAIYLLIGSMIAAHVTLQQEYESVDELGANTYLWCTRWPAMVAVRVSFKIRSWMANDDKI